MIDILTVQCQSIRALERKRIVHERELRASNLILFLLVVDMTSSNIVINCMIRMYTHLFMLVL